MELIHETTKQTVRGSAKKYPRSEGWIPYKYKDVSKKKAVIIENQLPNCAKKYIKFDNNDIPLEMNVTEKTAIDDAEKNKEPSKEYLIGQKMREQAIEALKADGILDKNGELK